MFLLRVGTHPFLWLLVLLLWLKAYPNSIFVVEWVHAHPDSMTVVVGQHPSKFAVQQYWQLPIKFPICCCIGSIPMHILQLLFWVNVYPTPMPAVVCQRMPIEILLSSWAIMHLTSLFVIVGQFSSKQYVCCGIKDVQGQYPPKFYVPCCGPAHHRSECESLLLWAKPHPISLWVNVYPNYMYVTGIQYPCTFCICPPFCPPFEDSMSGRSMCLIQGKVPRLIVTDD